MMRKGRPSPRPSGECPWERPAGASRGGAPSGDAALSRMNAGREQAVATGGETFFAKGKRGLVFLREEAGRTLLVKRKNPAAAVDTIANEARFTALLNAERIGPRFISYDAEKGELVREYVAGEEFRKWLPTAPKERVLPILMAVLAQCRTMDLLGVNKLEMTRPWKHIIVTSAGEPFLVDFERCRESKQPKNVTQFCQFLSGSALTLQLAKKGIIINTETLLEKAKEYRHNFKNNKQKQNQKLFNELFRILEDADH